MAAADVARGNASDFLALGATWEVFEGPNLQRAPDNLGQINKANGQFLQEDASRIKVSGTIKAYAIDGSAVKPEAGAMFDISGASAAPYAVRIDAVNDEGQNEDGYDVCSIQFHYFDDVTAADQTMTYTYMTTGV